MCSVSTNYTLQSELRASQTASVHPLLLHSHSADVAADGVRKYHMSG